MRNRRVIMLLCVLTMAVGTLQAQRLKAVQNEKGRYGFVTEDGEVVIKYKYDEATPFKNGIAKIGKDGKYSLIDESGEIITKRKYTYIGEFYNGICPVAEGGNTKKGVTFATGSLMGNEAASNNGEKWGLIDASGKEILKPDYEAMGALNQKLIYILKGKKFGFIDASGSIVIKPTYSFIGSFNKQGVCWVCIGGKYDKKTNQVSKGKFGIINESGREILPAKYNDVGNFPLSHSKEEPADQSAFPLTKADVQSFFVPKPHQSGSAFPESQVDCFYFTQKRAQGLVDVNGNTLVRLTANQAILPPTDGMVRLATIEKKQIGKAYYDLNAEVMVRIPAASPGKFGAFNHNLAPVWVSDELYFIDKRGNKVIGELKRAFDSNEGYRVVQRASAFGAIDSTGTVVVPIDYANALTLVSNGRMGVQKGTQWFFVDTKGAVVSDAYDRVGNYRQGYASVCRDKKWGVIDLQNQLIVPLAWQGIAPVTDPRYIWVQKENLFYLYDGTKQQLRLEKGYENAANFEDGMAYVMENKKWGIIDPEGHVLVPCVFEKEIDMVYAKKHMLAMGVRSLTEVQALQVIARVDPETNLFRITTIIPDKHWDY